MSLMKNYLAWFVAGTVTAVGIAISAERVAAQDAATGSAERLGTDDDGADPFGSSGNPFELIHRALSAPSLSTDEFQAQQQRAISNEAEAFRLRQQEALRQQETGVDSLVIDDAAEGDDL